MIIIKTSITIKPKFRKVTVSLILQDAKKKKRKKNRKKCNIGKTYL